MTLQNENLRSLVRDLRFHHDPLGMCAAKTLAPPILCDYGLVPTLTALPVIPSPALQSMVITKQPQIGGEGTVPYAPDEFSVVHVAFTVREHNDS